MIHNTLNLNKTGLVWAAILGGWHVVWALLVLLGFAQMVYDFILWAHMIHLPITIGPFDIGAALTLITVTAVFGYVIGYTAAWVWNRLS